MQNSAPATMSSNNACESHIAPNHCMGSQITFLSGASFCIYFSLLFSVQKLFNAPFFWSILFFLCFPFFLSHSRDAAMLLLTFAPFLANKHAKTRAKHHNRHVNHWKSILTYIRHQWIMHFYRETDTIKYLKLTSSSSLGLNSCESQPICFWCVFGFCSFSPQTISLASTIPILCERADLKANVNEMENQIGGTYDGKKKRNPKRYQTRPVTTNSTAQTVIFCHHIDFLTCFSSFCALLFVCAFVRFGFYPPTQMPRWITDFLFCFVVFSCFFFTLFKVHADLNTNYIVWEIISISFNVLLVLNNTSNEQLELKSVSTIWTNNTSIQFGWFRCCLRKN